MRKVILIMGLVLAAMVTKAQAPTVKYEYDTVKKTLTEWVDDIQTGHITSGYTTRIVKYQIRYELDSADVGKDKAQAKKVRVPIEAYHYKINLSTGKANFKDTLQVVTQDFDYDPTAPHKKP